ncbi:uncharacterized protein LOC130055216 [Ostrea edulis]|uniref:uncharacterized protein LOC130055216 n=1 Tax=Ostrea edulis TaxID=37623 RepID=UPI0024AF6C76|nr:uncharacterized protein LOC130055216 [Ostrea edulis]
MVVEEVEAEDDPNYAPEVESLEVSSNEEVEVDDEEEDKIKNSPRKKFAGRRKEGGPRQRKAYPHCGIDVMHLPLHLRNVHKRSRAEAKVEVKKSKSKLKECSKCGTVVLNAHKMTRGGDLHALGV